MKKKIELISLIDKLVKTYENTHKEVTFKFENKEGIFIFTDVSQGLLNIFNITRDEFLENGTNYYHIFEESLAMKLEKMYQSAWEGNKVIYFYTPYLTNKSIFLMVLLSPNFYKNKVFEVVGRCIPLDRKEFQYEANLLTPFEPLKILND